MPTLHLTERQAITLAHLLYTSVNGPFDGPRGATSAIVSKLAAEGVNVRDGFESFVTTSGMATLSPGPRWNDPFDTTPMTATLASAIEPGDAILVARAWHTVTSVELGVFTVLILCDGGIELAVPRLTVLEAQKAAMQ